MKLHMRLHMKHENYMGITYEIITYELQLHMKLHMKHENYMKPDI